MTFVTKEEFSFTVLFMTELEENNSCFTTPSKYPEELIENQREEGWVESRDCD